MVTIKLREGEEYIKLGQALKAAGFAESGVDAKFAVQDGLVSVNGEVDTRRGRKLFPGDTLNLKEISLRWSGKREMFGC